MAPHGFGQPYLPAARSYVQWRKAAATESWTRTVKLILLQQARTDLKRRMGIPFQNCAEPWMAEPKRHMDVPKERVLKGDTHSAPPQS